MVGGDKGSDSRDLFLECGVCNGDVSLLGMVVMVVVDVVAEPQRT